MMKLPLTLTAALVAGAAFAQGASKKPEPVKDGLEWVFIPAGTFQMGCAPSDGDCSTDEKPRHSVTLSRGFWIGKAEVTVAAYRRFVNATGRGMPSSPFFNADWRSEAHPIVNVDWSDAKSFCEWAQGRLPTEAEWEYAARGGREGTKYPWGDSIGPDKASYDGTVKGTSAVCSFPPNGFGLCDMVGSVLEWSADWYQDSYAASSAKDPKGPTSGPGRVTRGGSWNDIPRYVRITFRRSDADYHSDPFLGVRCVRDVAP